VSPAAAGVPAGLWVFVAALALQRLVELQLSARNGRRLRALGGHQAPGGHFGLIAAMHVMFPVALVAEVVGLGTRPTAGWPAWLGACVAAQGLRVAAMRALGPRWHVRLWVVPGMPPVRHGVYRFLRHPNYVGVALEILAAPMMFGAWRTALTFSTLNAVLLLARVRDEERALEKAAAGGDGHPLPRSTQ
jgi:methyltransferase